MKHIKQLKFVLAGIVAFTTVLTLIRPAITFENTICGLEEHTHTEECYQTIQNTVPHKTLSCTEESLHIHKHSPNCYDENNNIICGYADYMIHEHNEDCYDENNQLVCTLPEIKEHTHDDNCYDSENNLICDKQEFIEHTHDNNCYDPEGNLICGLPELKKHIHDDSCFTQTEEIIEDEQLICDKPEHIHTEECYETEEDIEYVCGKEEHTHDTSCYNEDNELICDKEEHVHSSECEKTIEDNIEEEIPAFYGIENVAGNYSLENDVSVYSNNIYVEESDTIWYRPNGLGDASVNYGTSRFWITINGVRYDAYCVEPLRSSPTKGDNDKYESLIPISSSSLLTKIYYYGSVEGTENFFSKVHKDFSSDKKYIINHLALSYVYWDEVLDDSTKNQYISNGVKQETYAFYGANETAKQLAMELISYANSKPSMPTAVIKMNNSNDVTLQAYLDGNRQRTDVIQYTSDNQQSVTFTLPEGIKFHKITSSGEETIDSGNVTLSGNMEFYFSATLDQKESFTQKLQGVLTKDYSVYTIKTKDRVPSGDKSQDLALIYGTTEGTSISFTVNWVNANLDIKKVQSNVPSTTIAGVQFQHTLPDNNTETLTTNEQGIIQLQNLSSGTHRITEIKAANGYQINENEFTFIVNTDGSITMDDLNGKDADYDTSTKTLTVKDKVNNYSLKIIKTNGNPDYKLKGAKFGLYKDQQCQELALSVDSIRETNENGELTFIGLENGVTYYLKEIYAPPGYIINDTIYSIKVELNPINNTKQVTINGNSESSFATFNENGFDNVVLSLKISNDAIEYILPETGGPGDWLYIGSGIGLITLAGYFLIKRRIHGKEDLISQ